MSTFTCHLCGHDHDTRDQLLALPGICGWCANDGEEDIYSGEDPAS